MAVTYYAINNGGNWTVGGTWSTISAKNVTRVGGTTAPTSADTCYLDDYSGNVTVNGASACLILDENTNGAYGGTLAFGTQTLTVSGSAKLYGAMTSTSGTLSVGTGVTLLSTITGTFPALTITGIATLTSGGFTWPGTLTFSATGTKTLVGNWINTGLVTFTGASNVNKTTTETLTTNGGLTMANSSGATPTATIIIGGTGGIYSATGLNTLYNPLNFNCTTATVSGAVYNRTATITWTAGTITTTGSTLNLPVDITLNTNGMTWQNITLDTAIYTLTSNLSCNGILSAVGISPTFSGASDISCGTLKLGPASSNSGIYIVAGRTLTVTAALKISGDATGTVSALVTSTTSSTAYLTYSGLASNQKVFAATFTHIDASGSAQGIDNWYGGTLTGTTNITNRTSADIGGAQPAVTDVFGVI